MYVLSGVITNYFHKCVRVGVCTCVTVSVFSLRCVICNVWWFGVGGAVCRRYVQNVCSVCICSLYVLCVHVFGMPVCVGNPHPATKCMYIHKHLFTSWSSTCSVFIHTSITLFTPNVLFKRSIFLQRRLLFNSVHIQMDWLSLHYVQIKLDVRR